MRIFMSGMENIVLIIVQKHWVQKKKLISISYREIKSSDEISSLASMPLEQTASR